MKILFATSELAPWVKTGGLADVAMALPAALRALGLDVRILLPFYPAMQNAFPHARVMTSCDQPGGRLPGFCLREATTPQGTPLLLLDCAALYQRDGGPYQSPAAQDWDDNHLRFGLLSRAAAWLGSDDCPQDWRCDIVHCNDWQTGLAPAYLHWLAGHRARTLITVHNLAFQGLFDRDVLPALGLPGQAYTMDGVEFHGHVSFLKAGLQFADAITTVSPTYAREIQTDEQGMGLGGLLRYRADKLVGILNGIDTSVWNPATDPMIEARYDARSLEAKRANKTALQRIFGLPERADVALLGAVSRLTYQKGLDLLPAITDALACLPVQIALLGSGDPQLEHRLTELAARYPDCIAVKTGFDETLAHRIEAGADMFLMPSRFEPCGLNQMYSLRYGTPPLVRGTGGLADTVEDGRSGFVFAQASPQALLETIQRALAVWQTPERWQQMQRAAMALEFGWERSARRYAEIYADLGRH
jgi:starch synthase